MTYSVQIDAMAVSAILDPTLFETERLRVDVETVSPLTLGQTVVDRRRHHPWTSLPEIDVARTVAYDRYLDRLVEALCGTGRGTHSPAAVAGRRSRAGA
jgi:inosine-uridine nucleoside N-ribohydrolase